MIVLNDSQLPKVGDLVWVRASGWGGHSEFTFDSAGIFLGRSKKHQKRAAFWLSDPSIVIEFELETSAVGDSSDQLLMALSIADLEKQRQATCWLNGLSHHLDGARIRVISKEE